MLIDVELLWFNLTNWRVILIVGSWRSLSVELRLIDWLWTESYHLKPVNAP